MVEQEKLELGAEEGLVGDTGVDQVLLGLGRHVARVAAVAPTGHRVVHIADELQRGHALGRVDARRVEVGAQQHVRLVDALEAAQRGAVEALAALDQVLIDFRSGNAEVLPAPDQVGHQQVDAANALILNQRLNLAKGCHGPMPLSPLRGQDGGRLESHTRTCRRPRRINACCESSYAQR